MAEGNATGFLSKDTAGLPNWAWLLVVSAGLAVAYIGPKYFGSKNQQQQTTGTDTTGLGLAIDPTTGLPYAVEGLVPSGGTVGTTGDQLPPPPAPPASTGLPPPTFIGPPQKSGLSGTVRQPGQFPAWDAAHTGVPILSAPGGSIIGYVPWGTALQIGNSVQGPSNQAGDPSAAALGSTQWFQTTFGGLAGYVSAADIGLNEQPLGLAPFVTSQRWPGGTTQVRMVG